MKIFLVHPEEVVTQIHNYAIYAIKVFFFYTIQNDTALCTTCMAKVDNKTKFDHFITFICLF